MAIEDLDLEFEDENEQERTDALDVDVDLSFSANEDAEPQSAPAKPVPNKRPRPAPKAAQRPTPRAQAQPANNSNVTNISEAQPARSKVQARPTSQVQPQPDYANESLGDIAQLKSEIETLKNQIQKIQHQADVKVAVAQAEKEYLVEVVSNAKVLDHQVTQILTRINKKVPALGSEVQTIKKYVSEFVKKTSPKKNGNGG